MTLTQAAILTRRTILTIIILSFLATVSVISFSLWSKLNQPKFVPALEKPEERFGKLPLINFPTSIVSSSNFSYRLDTNTGGLPQTPKMLKVYFIPQASATLLAPQRAKDLASKLGFPSSAEIVTPTLHRFTDFKGGSVNINLTTGNFSFQKEVASPSAQLKETPLSDQSILVTDFKNYLDSKNLLTVEIKLGKNKVVFSQTSQNDSQTAQISLWPSDIDNLPVVTPLFTKGLIKTEITKAQDEEDKFLSLDYIFWPVDKSTYSTYPLKSPDDAFEDLRSGRGYIAKEPKDPQISVTSVYLAYFESEEYSPYLQPVFVFEGSDFAAYVPAILSK